MGCGTTTVKIASVIFNVILGFIGFSTIVWIAFDSTDLREDVAIGGYILCSFLIFFSFLGCFAAIRESICLTSLCAVFLLVLAVLQITVTLMGLDGAANRASERAEKAWGTEEMNEIQAKYECCGKISVQDYILIPQDIPKSCYRDQNNLDLEALYTVGCVTKLYDRNDDERLAMQIGSWILVAFELTGFLLAVFLVINFRNTQRRMQF